jgi:hypothetical protein
VDLRLFSCGHGDYIPLDEDHSVCRFVGSCGPAVRRCRRSVTWCDLRHLLQHGFRHSLAVDLDRLEIPEWKGFTR